MKRDPKFLQAFSRWEGTLGACYLFKQWEKAASTGIRDHFLKELVCFPGASLKERRATFNFFACVCILAVQGVQRNGSSFAKLETRSQLCSSSAGAKADLINLQSSTSEGMGLGCHLDPAVQLSPIACPPSGVPSHPPSAPEAAKCLCWCLSSLWTTETWEASQGQAPNPPAGSVLLHTCQRQWLRGDSQEGGD